MGRGNTVAPTDGWRKHVWKNGWTASSAQPRNWPEETPSHDSRVGQNTETLEARGQDPSSGEEE